MIFKRIPSNNGIKFSGNSISMHPHKAATIGRVSALIDASIRIEAERPTGDEIAFMHAILCQIGLPRSNVPGERFERSSGSASLVVHAGEIWNGQAMVKQSIPYGSIPRLVLAHVTRYAVRHKSGEIPFGESANDAMRQLGIDKSGRSYAMFQRQVRALAACSITLGFNADGRAITFDGSCRNAEPKQILSACDGDIADAADFGCDAVQHGLDMLLGCHVEDGIQAFALGLVHCIDPNPGVTLCAEIVRGHERGVRQVASGQLGSQAVGGVIRGDYHQP